MSKPTATKLRILAKDFQKDGIVTDGSVLRCNVWMRTIKSVGLNSI